MAPAVISGNYLKSDQRFYRHFLREEILFQVIRGIGAEIIRQHSQKSREWPWLLFLF